MRQAGLLEPYLQTDIVHHRYMSRHRKVLEDFKHQALQYCFNLRGAVALKLLNRFPRQIQEFICIRYLLYVDYKPTLQEQGTRRTIQLPSPANHFC